MRLIDRYILVQTAKPLGVSLAVVLIALVLERLLRLFDLLATQGKQFGQIMNMLVNLVPHYLGLALPAAFFISIFLVSARFSEDSELDALHGCGLSVRRFSRPFLGLGVLLTVFSVALYGYIQPYSRYTYRSIFHVVTNAAWDASVTAGTFIDAGNGYTVYADRLDRDGRRLERVFIHETRPTGTEVTTTAESGFLQASADSDFLRLRLHNVVQIRTAPGENPAAVAFDELLVDHRFPRDIPLFRSRGDSERELTMTELRREMADPGAPVPHSRLVAEFHARLVRSVSLMLLPMLAVPMGMAAKRSFRWQGIAVAAVILLLYHHAVQFGESLGDLGRVPPVLSLWGPFAVFAALCLALYLMADRRPGVNPFEPVFEAVDGVVRRVRRLLPRRRVAT
ncbi:LptF/LptG family permease [Azospirillum sp. ST 5-10]|uniref:LptF/LptG family permease n=1 Tax=unclassified Azospirillum TaxID=2630922 RepID=UPI003F4A7675